MFDFLKKSRVFRFLCSTCLIYSLGSFTNINAQVPGKVDGEYIQAPLGFDYDHIILDGATIDSNTGKMSGGTFKYKKIEVQQLFNNTSPLYFRENITNKTWNDIITYYCDTLTLTGISQQTLENAGYKYRPWYNQYLWYEPGNTYGPIIAVNDPATGEIVYAYGTLDAARVHYLKNLSEDDPLILDILEKSDWQKMYETSEYLQDLSNPDEDSKLVLSIPSEGVTGEIDLAGKNYSLKGVQFYESDSDDVIADESAAKLSLKPGVYPLHAILTEKGDKTLISGPVMEKVAESSEESV